MTIESNNEVKARSGWQYHKSGRRIPFTQLGRAIEFVCACQLKVSCTLSNWLSITGPDRELSISIARLDWVITI